MYKGSCLCGKVRFEITSEIKDIVFCHCSNCRKAQGSAFATNANVSKDGFRFVSGEDDLTSYQSSPQRVKYFCKHCGSPIISKNSSQPDIVRIRLGSIEGDIKEKPKAHIFVGSKANWEEINDNLPKYDTY